MIRKLLRLQRNRAVAFTLIEIMVVVIVIGVVVSLVLPNLSGSENQRKIETTANQIGEALDYAHNAALTSGQVYGVEFNSEDASYELVKENPPSDEDIAAGDSEPKMGPVRPTGVKGLGGPVPDGISIKQVARMSSVDERREEMNRIVRVLFFPDGTTEFAKITLASKDGDMRQIEINGMSGEITVSASDKTKSIDEVNGPVAVYGGTDYGSQQ